MFTFLQILIHTEESRGHKCMVRCSVFFYRQKGVFNKFNSLFDKKGVMKLVGTLVL